MQRIMIIMILAASSCITTNTYIHTEIMIIITIHVVNVISCTIKKTIRSLLGSFVILRMPMNNVNKAKNNSS